MNLLDMIKKMNGWKTVVAAIYWPVEEQVIPLLFPTGEPKDVHVWLVTLGIVLSAIGVGHKWYKATEANESTLPTNLYR